MKQILIALLLFPFFASAQTLGEVRSVTKLTGGTTSGTTTLSIDMSAYYNVYDKIVITFTDIRPSTDNTNLSMRTSADASTYDNSAGNYQYAMVYAIGDASPTAGPLGSNSATEVVLGNSYDNTATNSNLVRITFYKLSQTALKPSWEIYESYVNNSNVTVVAHGSGTRLSAGPIKATRFLFSSGNINATYTVEGYKY